MSNDATAIGMRTVLLDANILCSYTLRTLMLELADSETCNIKWTRDIRDEWLRSMRKVKPATPKAELISLWNRMNEALPDRTITGHGKLIRNLKLNDPDDRHVLAAAIYGGCDTILTLNLSDFPAEALAPHGVIAQSPDDFLCDLIANTPGSVCAVLKTMRDRFENPSYSQAGFLDMLAKNGMKNASINLRRYAQYI